ncbi:hypothetical protein EJB05_33987, partial [Eragrostis curvula]
MGQMLHARDETRRRRAVRRSTLATYETTPAGQLRNAAWNTVAGECERSPGEVLLLSSQGISISSMQEQTLLLQNAAGTRVGHVLVPFRPFHTRVILSAEFTARLVVEASPSIKIQRCHHYLIPTERKQSRGAGGALISIDRSAMAGAANCIDILIAIILPPLGVFLKFGCGHEFWICLLLTFLGYLPGIIYAVYAITK